MLATRCIIRVRYDAVADLFRYPLLISCGSTRVWNSDDWCLQRIRGIFYIQCLVPILAYEHVCFAWQHLHEAEHLGCFSFQLFIYTDTCITIAVCLAQGQDYIAAYMCST